MKWAVRAAAVVAFISCFSPAAAEDAPRAAFSGPYAGISGGYTGGDAALALDGSSLGSLSLNGPTVGGFAGFAFRHEDFHAAVEIDGAYAPAEDSVATPFGRMRLRSRGNVGASVIAGAVIRERVLVYGRAGYRAVIFEGEAGGTSFTDAARGPSIGGGVAVAIGDALVVRLEARNSFLAERRYRSGGVTLRVDPDDVAAGIGIAYRF